MTFRFYTRYMPFLIAFWLYLWLLWRLNFKRRAMADKPTLRICHIADIHLGYRRYNKLTKEGFNQREVDVNLAFQEAVDRIAMLKPDLTIIAGDLFHTVRPSNAIITFGFKQIRRLASVAPVIIVAGNHESPKRIDTGCLLKLYSEIPGVFISESRADRFPFPDLKLSVQCLPHASLADLEPRSVRAIDSFTYNVLVAHGQVSETWISDFGGVEVDIKALSPNEWDYIALGHVHSSRDVSYNASYSGATEHTAANIWAEGDMNKGFLEVVLPEGKRIFHALTSPREIVVLDPINARSKLPEEINTEINERMESVPGGVEGKLVRLQIDNISREAFRALDHKQLRAWRTRALNLTLDIRHAKPAGESKQSKQAERGGVRTELKKFLSLQSNQFTDASAVSKTIEGFLEKLEEVSETR